MRKLKTNPYRLGIQLAIMSIILVMLIIPLFRRDYVPDFEAVCPFGGIQAFSSFLVNNSLACTMTSIQVALGAALILAIILFSKLFCSYICPVGSVAEWLGELGQKWKLRITITGTTDKLLRAGKYGLLFITFYFTLTSSELFCKWFCPYFGIVSGFDPDVNVIMAISAIAIVVLGSIFFRLFWCKYLCPLGALSNIFRFFIMFCLVTGIYVILLITGIQLSFIWPLVLICILGYVFELLSLQSRTFPIFRITRDESKCTSCKLCSKTCPMAIEVDKQQSVKHIDCHMCADCIEVCPEKGALSINRKGKKWLPALVLVVLVLAGIGAGKSFELPTINEYWAEPETRDDMEVYSISGLESIRCYGSSVAVANHLYKMDGIYGVSTFVKDHELKIWYDPDYTDTLDIREWIFSPGYILIRKLPEELVSLKKYRLEIENFFDISDDLYLSEILANDNSIYGFETDFACPIKVTIYYDAKVTISSDALKDMVEQKLPDEIRSEIHHHYRVISIRPLEEEISARDFEEMF